jgi:Tol biopolymer transport system component
MSRKQCTFSPMHGNTAGRPDRSQVAALDPTFAVARPGLPVTMAIRARAVQLSRQSSTTLLFLVLLTGVCSPIRSQPARGRTAEDCRPDLTRAPDGLVVWSPNGKQYIVNKQDAAGTFQLYVGNANAAAVCITCTQKPNGPAPNLHKLQPHWHPSGEWIVLAGEMADFQPPVLSTPALILGWIQSGLWVNIYMTRPDGSQWSQLSNFVASQPPNGFTGVAFTPDGKKAAWAQIVDGNVFKYPFGRWQLILADYKETNGVPAFVNLRDITPAGALWVEPGNFAPDNKSLLITSDIGIADAQGMDQFILDITTGKVLNLTNSPTVWDEHGVFSPDGTKILFMSSYPFRSQPLSDWAIFLKTEFMMMNTDGSHLEQLTHFNYSGYPESDAPSQGSVAANGEWSPDGKSISALNLFFPNYQTWSMVFDAQCAHHRYNSRQF